MAETGEKQSMDFLNGKLVEVRRFWEKLPKQARIMMVLVLVLAVGAAVALALFERNDEQVLFSGLSQEDAAAIVEHLKGKKVPYRLHGDGGTILVPAENVHELRLELASQGIPVGGGVGFELFDEKRFGMTEFEERVALRRALEGELSRTISRLDAIKSARVHLVLPKKSLLGRNSEAAEASITVELQKSRELSKGSIQSIIHLVSSSVEGLNPDSVTVIDTRGRLLSNESGMGFGARELEYQKKYENELELRLREMLDQILGPENSVVRVSAHFDFSKKEVSEEHYDPERSVLRSEQREVETSGSRSGGAVGTPGTRSNLPGAPAPGSTVNGENRKREAETRNYEVDKVVSHTKGPIALLSRLSVAVLVNGKNKPGEAFKSRSANELKQLDLAIRSAIGFDVRRGDKVEVQSVPFHIPEKMTEPESVGPAWWKEWLPLFIGGAVALAILIFLLSFRRKKGKGETAIETLQFPRRVDELETIIERPEGLPDARQDVDLLPPPRETTNTAALMDEVRNIFMEESEGASRVLKAWLSEAKPAGSAASDSNQQETV